MIIAIEQPRKVLELLQFCSVLEHNPNPMQMSQHGGKAEGDQRVECVDGPKGLTLVDAKNGFNELSCYAILWTARHCWPKGVWFTFNCYKHHARCLVRSPGGKPSILLSREGVTQGCPKFGIIYGL